MMAPELQELHMQLKNFGFRPYNTKCIILGSTSDICERRRMGRGIFVLITIN
jgi:hypothetical protein